MMKKNIQTKCLLPAGAFLVCAATLLSGCDLQSYDSPSGYDLGHAQKFDLGKDLNEISGICYNAEDSTLLAISDSKKKVFELNVKKPKLKDYTENIVPPDSDLEDIAKVGDKLYLLGSAGVIFEVPKRAQDTTGMVTYRFPSEGKNDFETLYYDPSVRSLVMLCKTCAADKGKHTRSAYRFDLETKSFDTTAFYAISTDDVKKLVKNDDAKFDPSAADIHPLNKRLYILSSAGNLLVIADTRGKVIEGFNLNPDEHPQAEGIAFAPNGDIFISNEGKYNKPTLQRFPYHNGKK